MNPIKSESGALSDIRLEASEQGFRLWRNNVGAATTNTGHFIRFGLSNDSAALNAVIKSSDLIGIRPIIITEQHIGKQLGIFLAREVKKPGWKFSGTKQEIAQLAWIELIRSLGGDACFTTGRGSFHESY